MKTLFRSFTAAVAVLAIGAGASACKSAEPYAAKVNGIVLSKTDLDDELNAIRNNPDYVKGIEDSAAQNGSSLQVTGTGEGTLDSAFVARVLTRRIYLELVHQEFVRRNLKLKASDLTSAHEELAQSIGDTKILTKFPKSYLNEIERTTAEVAVLSNALSTVDSSDAALQKYYADNQAQFESVCASHILVATKAAADKIEKSLTSAKDKAATFASIAKDQSTDTGSGAQGGNLGCAAPAGYVKEFADAVESQKVGVIGDPVKSQFGYHIIRVDSRTPAPPFDQVKEQVREAVANSGQSAFNDFLDKTSKNAKVEINPRYGTFDRSSGQGQVVPPKSPDNAG